ncbi:MAG: metal-dependent hydrolase [Nitrospirota bacterium]
MKRSRKSGNWFRTARESRSSPDIMSPIGHLTISYVSSRTFFRNLSLTALLVGGVLPDIDFLFLFFKWFNQAHRVVSHNLLFILTASLFAAAVSDKGQKKAAGLSLLAGGMLHLMIDSVMDINPTNGIGIALFWPFSDKFFSPFNILNPSLNLAGWSNPMGMVRTLIPGLLYEIPFYIIAAILFFRQKRTCP